MKLVWLKGSASHASKYLVVSLADSNVTRALSTLSAKLLACHRNLSQSLYACPDVSAYSAPIRRHFDRKYGISD